MDTTIALVYALAALAAILVGPLAAVYTARLQVKSAVLSGNRQQWINAVRDEIANCMVLLVQCGNIVSESAGDSHTNRTATYNAHIEELARSVSKIHLHLNPLVKGHLNLMALIDEATKRENWPAVWGMNQCDRDSADRFRDRIRAYRKHIVEASQTILVLEWERVKKIK